MGCLGCGMFEMWDVWDVGCLGCGCWGCGMFEMWDVRDVGCEMRDVYRDMRSLRFLLKRSKNGNRQTRTSNLNWRLSFFTRVSHKKPSKRCSSKNFLNNELFLLNFFFSSFLFEENFRILKR